MQGNPYSQASFKKSGLMLRFKFVLSKCKNSCLLLVGIDKSLVYRLFSWEVPGKFSHNARA